MNIESKWHGPYSVISGGNHKWIAEVPEALGPGVYLWTSEFDREYRPYYVGIGRSSITARTLQHLADYYRGMSRIEDLDKFRSGTLCGPLYRPNSDYDWESERERILPKLTELLREFRFFFAPISKNDIKGNEREILERIETALIDEIREHQERARPTIDFLSNVKRSRLASNLNVEVHIMNDRSINCVRSRFVAKIRTT